MRVVRHLPWWMSFNYYHRGVVAVVVLRLQRRNMVSTSLPLHPPRLLYDHHPYRHPFCWNQNDRSIRQQPQIHSDLIRKHIRTMKKWVRFTILPQHNNNNEDHHQSHYGPCRKKKRMWPTKVVVQEVPVRIIVAMRVVIRVTTTTTMLRRHMMILVRLLHNPSLPWRRSWPVVLVRMMRQPCFLPKIGRSNQSSYHHNNPPILHLITVMSPWCHNHPIIIHSSRCLAMPLLTVVSVVSGMILWMSWNWHPPLHPISYDSINIKIIRIVHEWSLWGPAVSSWWKLSTVRPVTMKKW